MSGYHSSSDASGLRAPRKPLLRSVALPAGSPMNSPTAPSFPQNQSSTSRFSQWIGRNSNIFPRSQTPVPPESQRRDSSFHQAPPLQSNIHSRVRKSSASSNISDRSTTAPLKGILKKPGSSKSSTPAPPEKTFHIPPLKPESSSYTSSSSSSMGTASGNHRHHHKYSSSSSSSRMDGYASDSHALWKRKVPSDEEAPGSGYESASGKPVGGYHKTPLKVPMKSEAIALSWPLTEVNRTKQRLQRRVCFDIAFDPRKPRGVTVPITPDVAHRMDMPYDIIRLPASTHCTLTEMRISLDHEEFKRWPIKVKRKEGVRCLDVYEAIYKTLQHRLTDDDVRAFGEARIQRCFNFYLQRCADSPGLSDYNKQHGMRRVDLLRGKRFFRGLQQSGDDWILLLDDYSEPYRH